MVKFAYVIAYGTPIDSDAYTINNELYFQLDNAVEAAKARAIEGLTEHQEMNEDDENFSIVELHLDELSANEVFYTAVASDGVHLDSWVVLELNIVDTPL